MAEPTIICPQCKTEIKLTESLAAPLLESVKRDYEQRLSQKDADMTQREQALAERAQSLEKAKANSRSASRPKTSAGARAHRRRRAAESQARVRQRS